MDWPSLHNQLHALGWIALSGLLGGIIGLEREFRHKPAGLRTHLLVAASATLLVLLGLDVVEMFNDPLKKDLLRADPIRIIQAIIVGLSFIGAGTVIHQDKQEVEGLTTASSLLFTAAIGITVAVGLWFLAAALTLLVVVCLIALGWLERRFIDKRKDSR